jgi:hypothetical protein
MADGASSMLRQTLSEVQEHIQLGRLQSEALDRTAQHIATIEERLRVLEKSNASVLKQTAMGLIALTAMREAIRREALHVYGAAASVMDHPQLCMPPPPVPALARAAGGGRAGSSAGPAARALADAPIGAPRHVQDVLCIGVAGDELGAIAGIKRPCADPAAGPPRLGRDRPAPMAPAGETLPGGGHAAEAGVGGWAPRSSEPVPPCHLLPSHHPPPLSHHPPPLSHLCLPPPPSARHPQPLLAS